MTKSAGLYLLIFTICLLTKAVTAQQNLNNFTLQFINTFNGIPIKLDSVTYTNFAGENFTISKLKYYISNIQLNSGPSAEFKEPDSYHLIDEAEEGSKSFSFSLPSGKFSTLSFIIGVDSIKNVSGAQTDQLDPLNGMFWTWNTGYVMFKLEGRSAASHLTNNKIEYHIGGFKGLHNVLRKVDLRVPSSFHIKNKEDKIELVINMDLAKLWNAEHSFTIAETPACTTPGSIAAQIADNYAGLFNIIKVSIK